MQDRPRRFGGRFRATRVLKSGPAGETMRGINSVDGSEVVIRTMASSDPTAGDRLEHELANLAASTAPTSPGHWPAAARGGVRCSVVPYVPGATLETHLRARVEPLALVDALAVGVGVLRDLANAHERGLLHRDIRPSNIVVQTGARPAGEGLKRVTLVEIGSAQRRKVAGSPPEIGLCTARYASPEAADLVAREVDERSDVYSFEAVLFECLAARPRSRVRASARCCVST